MCRMNPQLRLQQELKRKRRMLAFSVGNKNDDPARKRVDTQDAMRFGETVGVRVFETSAKENINVEEVTSLLFHANLCLGNTLFLPTTTTFSAIMCNENKVLRLKSIFRCCCRSDVHGLYPHGAAGQEAEPEQS